jgi:hypothetical protein
MRDVVQQLLQAGLTGVDLLWTFVSHRILPLWQWEVTMWMYPGPSCSNHSFSIELDNAEINTRVQRILALGAIETLSLARFP